MKAKKKIAAVIVLVIAIILVIRTHSKALTYECLYTNGRDQGSWVIETEQKVKKISVETKEFSDNSFVVISIWSEEGLQIGREILFTQNSKQTQKLEKVHAAGRYTIKYSIYGTISTGWIVIKM